MFVSCSDDPQTLIEKANAALKEASYAATLKFNFETNSGILDYLKNKEIILNQF